jgi:hypothetical protein
MSDQIIGQAKLIVLQLLPPGVHTAQEIQEQVGYVVPMLRSRYPGVDIDVERIIHELQEDLNIFQPDSVSIDDDHDHQEWLLELGDSIAWRFWDRYTRYLREQEHLPPRVLDRLANSTEGILRKLENPARHGPWDRRGMVVGQVQSGKTANYTGLICRAADAGYRLIVVLAGIHNNLRSQTQLRLDAGFLGMDTQRRQLADTDAAFAAAALGVGRLLGAPRLDAASLTSSAENGDFGVQNAARAGISVGGYPVLLVVKKHRGILNNLRQWVTQTHGTGDPRLVRDFAILMIDDEADNASVNTRDQTDQAGEYDPDIDPTAVNRAIRQLLNAFEKKAYVGYTATPYANIFIQDEWEHPEFGRDLFPRAFINYLRPPSNYFGPARLFGLSGYEEPMPIHRQVDDQQNWVPERHKSDLRVGPLPDSVRTAIRSFVLAKAIRLARGQGGQHNSMLIHVTRFTAVQQQVRDQVQEELDDLRGRIRFGDGAGPSIREELGVLYEKDFAETTRSPAFSGPEPLPWAVVEEFLDEAVKPIVIRTINGMAQDALEYFENRATGLSVIAIGGDKLSRGLTLEGLTVSYYLRAARAYDTLFQMGRWFGYRTGYEDLCRLWTTGPLWNSYRQVTLANEELITDFEEMDSRNLTPRDYGLKVRGSVNGMMVTAPGKMRAGTRVRIGFSGALAESVVMYCDRLNGEANFETVDAFVASLADEHGIPEPGRSGNYAWSDVGGAHVADNFFAQFRTPPGAWKVNAPTIAEYIRNRIGAGELTTWTVALISASGAEKISYPLGGCRINLTQRSPSPDRKDKIHEGLYSIGRILSPSDEWIDFTRDEYLDAKDKTQHGWTENPGRRKTMPTDPSGPVIRRCRPVTKGLLLIYPLEPVSSELRGGDPEVTQKPIMGFAVSFPRSPDAPLVDYVVNQRFVDELAGDAEE